MCHNFRMVLDFEQDKKRAMVRGFWRGLAAPASLFTVHEAPAAPKVGLVVPPTRDVPTALNGDWKRVGDSIRVAIERYEREEE